MVNMMAGLLVESDSWKWGILISLDLSPHNSCGDWNKTRDAGK
jgi:hypothetical protein